LKERDLIRATVRIALKEREHRPLLHCQFPEWVNKVVYWDIHDIDAATVDETLSAIESKVVAITKQLSDRVSPEKINWVIPDCCLDGMRLMPLKH
jgi:protein-tyrosine phosphatase